jgi:type VI secretion system protein ImpK
MATDPSPFNDPFASLEGQRTFIKPNPGGRPASERGYSSAEPVPGGEAPDSAAVTHGLNPLLAVANPLLMLVPRLRHARSMPDVAGLRARLVQGIRDFATSAQASQIAPERVMAARYVLCTMLDEAASDTPWGGSGVWGRHSLLTEFHNEVSGGEKVFQLMARLAEQPQANRDLLELIYAAISLGFEGRYRIVEGGRAQLEAVRAKLAQLIAQQRGPYPKTLAEHWQGSPAATRRVLSWLPLAVTAALALLLMGLLYGLLSWSLAGRADPVFAQIQRLRLAPPVTPVAQPATQPRLAQFLQSDIKAGLVTVRDEVDRSVVTIRGDGLFAPASATLAEDKTAVMQRIAQALISVPGAVLVTGHTDNSAMRGSLRFPSNWHLSDERARAVRNLMVATGLPAARVQAEGRADGEPAAPNDSPANKALNRRVEVTLWIGRADNASAAPRQSAAAAVVPAPAMPAPAAAASR